MREPIQAVTELVKALSAVGLKYLIKAAGGNCKSTRALGKDKNDISVWERFCP